MLTPTMGLGVKILPLIDNSKRILVVGDLVLDKYVSGTCSRIAQERPVPIFRESDTEYRIGGAGNVLTNVDALGFSVDLLSVLGKGDKHLIEMFKQRNFSLNGLVFLPEYEVLTLTRYMVEGHLMFRADKRKEYEISADVEEQILQRFITLISGNVYQAIIIAEYRSDFRCSMISEKVVSKVISLATQNAIPTIVDPKKGDYGKFYGTTYIKPNQADASYFLQRSIKTDHDIEEACKKFCERLNTRTCCMTLSERGIAFYEKGIKDGMPSFKIIPTGNNVFASDVSGAGDTVTAALAFGIINNWKMEDSCSFANMCAADVVQRQGTVPVKLVDVLPDKVISSRLELTNLKRLIQKDACVVLTVGSFDIAHLGHIELLRKSKEMGDYLIVVVNSDMSTNMNDGVGMPICTVEERVGVLQAIKYIDFIVTFDELYPQWIVEILEPDVFVEGKQIDEHQIREIYPSLRNIQFIKMEDQISTKNIINKIKRIEVCKR